MNEVLLSKALSKIEAFQSWQKNPQYDFDQKMLHDYFKVDMVSEESEDLALEKEKGFSLLQKTIVQKEFSGFAEIQQLPENFSQTLGYLQGLESFLKLNDEDLAEAIK